MIKAAIKVGLWVVLFALALGFMAGRAGATSSESDPYPEPPVEECPIADAIDAGWTPGGDIPCGHGPQNDDTPSTTVPEDPAPEQGIAPVVPPLIQVPVDDGSGGYTPEICPDQFPSIAAAQNSNCVEEYPPPVEQGITAPLDMSNTVTRQPVQGEGAVRPPTPLPPALAVTGATTEALVLIGLVLVAMGLGMVHGHLVVRSVTKWWEERS